MSGVPEPSSDASRLVLLPPFVDFGVASMNRFSEELLKQLQGRSSLTVTVAAGGTGPRLPDKLPARISRPVNRFLWYPAVAHRLEGDVFHVLDQGHAHVSAALPRDRVIVTCHDLIPLHARAAGWSIAPRRSTLLWYRFAVSFMRAVAHVACDSEATRRDLIELLGVAPERASVVHPGVSPVFTPLSGEDRDAARGSFPHDTKLVLHVSSGAPYKNVAGTLRTLALLRKRGRKALLLRVGPRLTPEQQRIAEGQGVSRHVVELGHVSDERLAELYNVADALLFPSYWEGFGWPAAEALACGCPTVISTCPSLLEITGDAALAVPASDHGGLVAAIERIWDSPETRDQLRQRGLRRTRELSWKAAGDSYEQIYQRVAEWARPSREKGLT